METVLDKLVTFGALGIICAFLLWERHTAASKDRAARHALANAITANTAATETLIDKIRDLSTAIWNAVLVGGGGRRHGDHVEPKED